MVICDVQFDTKYDPVIQNLSQEPSMSSKYDCVLDAHIMMLERWKFEYNPGITIYMDDVKFDIRYDPTLQKSCQEQSLSSKYDCVIDALLIMLGSWKWAYNSLMKYDGYLWCQIWYQI